jgi:DNA-binding beta-propeller fold protein YncE
MQLPNFPHRPLIRAAASRGSDTVTPINTATVGNHPGFIAITPNGTTAYITAYTSDTVTRPAARWSGSASN